jgi:hypothetical protein
MAPAHQVTMLKFIKNLSMLSSTHEALQNSNAIDILIELLKDTRRQKNSREISNQILNTMYNLCRHNKSRQEEAALSDVIPLLKEVVTDGGPLKEFALPILCELAHSGKVARKMLWQAHGLQFYINMLADRNWQVTALDAIFVWYVLLCIRLLRLANIIPGFKKRPPASNSICYHPISAPPLSHHTHRPKCRSRALRACSTLCRSWSDSHHLSLPL